MPGPYTHILICQRAAAPSTIPSGLQTILDKYHCFLLLGALSPDLPSIWTDVNKSGWRDIMHEGTGTNRIPTQIFRKLRFADDPEATLAWLFGYVGHMITDATIHPVTSRIQTARGEDDICLGVEICQDAICFHDNKLTELNAVHVHNWLSECHSPANHDAFSRTMSLWNNTLETWQLKPADCSRWYFSYLAALESAHTAHFQFRGRSYPAVRDISEQDKNDFYSNVPLPDRTETTGSFMETIVTHAETRLREYWTAIWEAWLTRTNIDDVITDWNLNTGANRDSGRHDDLW